MNISKVFILLILLALAAPQSARGQFWKKWFDKEEKRRPRTPAKPREKDPEAPVAKRKRKTLEYPASRIKGRYRVDVMVPLYLDELVRDNKVSFKGKLPEKAASGISFYEGVKLAADTLNSLGYNIDIYVHDITQKSLSPEEHVKGEVLAETDLIIGALQSREIPVVADFARKQKVNLISVISPSDADIKGNLFFTMLQPTLETHCVRLKEAAFRKYQPRSIFLFYRYSNTADSIAASYILSGDEKTFRMVPLDKGLNKANLEHLFDSSYTNVVIMPVVDNGAAESTLVSLHTMFPRYRFEVYGMPSWKFIPGLKKADSYPNIGINFTSPFYYDLSQPGEQILASSHRRQFNGRPGEMTFRGYEILFWYATLLQRYGTVYNARQGDNATAPFTPFEVKPRWDQQQDFLYNENQHLYLYRYQSGSFSLMPL